MRLVVPPDPLTVPTWLTAIFTGVLAVGAIVTAIFAILAFRKQSAELGVLQRQAKDQADQLDVQRQQADDQRKVNEKQTTVLELQARELKESLEDRQSHADERRRAQAEQVFVWVDRPAVMPADIPAGASHQIAVHVKNASAQPIQGVMFTWYRGHTFWGTPNTVPYLMPGDEHSATRRLPDDLPGNFDLRMLGAIVMFRDRAKKLWRITRDGSLAEVTPGEPPDALLSG